MGRRNTRHKHTSLNVMMIFSTDYYLVAPSITSFEIQGRQVVINLRPPAGARGLVKYIVRAYPDGTVLSETMPPSSPVIVRDLVIGKVSEKNNHVHISFCGQCLASLRFACHPPFPPPFSASLTLLGVQVVRFSSEREWRGQSRLLVRSNHHHHQPPASPTHHALRSSRPGQSGPRRLVDGCLLTGPSCSFALHFHLSPAFEGGRDAYGGDRAFASWS